MASSLSTEIATTFLSFTTCPQNPFAKVQTTVLPVLFKPRARNLSNKTTPSSSDSKFIAVNTPKPYCRFTVSASASAATTTTSEDSDLLTKIPPNNRIPATIITCFLGSGKEDACCWLWLAQNTTAIGSGIDGNVNLNRTCFPKQFIFGTTASSYHVAGLEASGDLMECWNVLMELKPCSNEIIIFFLNGQADICPDCCRAIDVIKRNCWPAMLTSFGGQNCVKFFSQSRTKHDFIF